MEIGDHVLAAGRGPPALRLGEAGGDRDSDLVAAARALMSLMDAAGSLAGKYVVDVRGSQGVQIGDHNEQQSIFSVPPGGSGERG